MILAADFGGTTIKLGIVRDGIVMARSRLPAQAGDAMTERLEAVAGAWEKLLGEAGATLKDCRGAALSLPFLIHPTEARVLGEFGKFAGAAGIDFDAWSQARLGRPVALDTDVRVALLGEWKLGAARGKSDVVMFALGTGIGCAVVLGNRLLHGAHNRAAVLMGHATVDYRGDASRCGNLGCAEDLASTATLRKRAEGHPTFPDSPLARADSIDFETVVTCARQGDACSAALLDESLRVWAAAVQHAVLAYDPEIVVLGGGVLRSADLVVPAIEKHLHAHMPGLTWEVPVVPAALGDDAALLGAEVLFHQTHPELAP